MKDYVSAFAGYFPWIVVLLLGLIFRRSLSGVMQGIAARVTSDSSMKVTIPGGGSVEFGELVKDTEDAVAVAEKQGTAIKTFGDPDQLKLLFKVQGDTWRKSTKALPVPGGCVVQMTTERRGQNGSWTTAEAIEFVPGVTVVEDVEKGHFKLERAIP